MGPPASPSPCRPHTFPPANSAARCQCIQHLYLRAPKHYLYASLAVAAQHTWIMLTCWCMPPAYRAVDACVARAHHCRDAARYHRYVGACRVAELVCRVAREVQQGASYEGNPKHQDKMFNIRKGQIQADFTAVEGMTGQVLSSPLGLDGAKSRKGRRITEGHPAGTSSRHSPFYGVLSTRSGRGNSVSSPTCTKAT